jgi:DNA-binding HxlR family transcriptional regulator
MKRTDFGAMSCSIAQTLNVVGEWWTWLIIRDIRMGIQTFTQIQKNTGISKKVLTDRLTTLIENEIISQVDATNLRKGYQLTEKGLDLVPVLRTMINWGDKWVFNDDGPVKIEHNHCGKFTHVKLVCDQCGEDVTHDNCTAHFNDELTMAMTNLNEA